MICPPRSLVLFEHLLPLLLIRIPALLGLRQALSALLPMQRLARGDTAIFHDVISCRGAARDAQGRQNAQSV